MSTARKQKSVNRKPAQNSSAKARKNASPGRWKKTLYILSASAVLALAVHLLYLNHLIGQRFDGETWARPSRVYARPLELYTGMKIVPQQLIEELKLADYQAVDQVTRPGHFSYTEKQLTIYSREFYFADHHQDETLISLRLSNNEVMQISNQTLHTTLDFFQLTPVLFGSFISANGEDRLVIDAQDIPPQLSRILLAVEDKHFFSHWGVSPLSILRALWANIQAGKTVQGGSTLTQQLAKNMFLTSERSLLRKFNEALMALMLELRFSKDNILAAYINEVFLLQQKNISINGFALASKLLFKQSLDNLSRDRLALLVGMVKGPSIYNPLLHPERALKRRNQVLEIMHNEGLISAAELQALASAGLGVSQQLASVNQFPAYLDLVKKQLASSYSSSDLAAIGLSIFTAFDPIKQRQLEQGLQTGLQRFNNQQLQAAVVVADYLNGDLIALTGGRDTDFAGFNRAILAQRPIGSLIKPLLLYGFLQNGKSLASIVDDRPIRVKQSDGEIWSPQNYDKKLHGETTLYQAFIKSYNLPFVHLGLEKNGLKTLTANLQKIDLLRQQVIYPSLLLGATQMTPLEVAQMYQVIANSGYFTPLTTIREVTDKQHKLLSRIPLHSVELFDRKTMLQVQRALIGVVEEGTASYLHQRYTDKIFGGKTGTTNDLRDSWFAGFSSRYLTVVWLGDDQNNSIKLSGSTGALRLWADIIQQFDDRSLKLAADPELVWHYVDRQQGGISGKNCANSVLLPFPVGSEPQFNSDCNNNVLEKGIHWLQELF